MQVFKKLIFAIPFLLLFYWSIYLLSHFIVDTNLIFNFDLQIFLSLILALIALTLSLYFFAVFSVFAQDYKIVLPVVGVACFAGAVYLPLPLSYFVVAGLLLTFGVVYYFLDQKIKTCLAFQPNNLLLPALKTLASLIFIVLSFAYFTVASQEIKEKGFQIPDSLIDAALQIAGPGTGDVQGTQIAQVPSITPEQIAFLKKNPQLLKQAGLDPKVLESLNQKSSSSSAKEATSASPQQSNGAVKGFVKAQFQKMIESYMKYIPYILAALFFTTLQGLFYFISIFLPIINLLLFWILEKTGFIHFEKEMREVRKLVV